MTRHKLVRQIAVAIWGTSVLDVNEEIVSRRLLPIIDAYVAAREREAALRKAGG